MRPSLHPPALLAKAPTSLDVLTGDRLPAGLRIGWMTQEDAAGAVPLTRRGVRRKEYLCCLHALWTQDR